MKSLINNISNNYETQPHIIYGIIMEYGRNCMNPLTYIGYEKNDFRVGLTRVPFSKSEYH